MTRIGIELCLLLILFPTMPAAADIIVFNDESSYLTTLTSLSYQIVFEGFEDDAVWGSVRTTISGGTFTAPSITDHGITWKANNSISEVTTGHGPVRTGEWGFFTLPHGDPPTISFTSSAATGSSLAKTSRRSSIANISSGLV